MPPAFEGDVGWAHGTVTNLADFPMEFTIHLAGLFLEPQAPVGEARAVLPGQTAVWRAPFVHPDYTPRIGTVEYRRVWPRSTNAQAVITHVGPADFAGWSAVTGTVTNAGADPSGFAIEVQTTNGEIDVGYAAWVGPGETAPWEHAVFHGTPQAPRVFRVVVWPPYPMMPMP